MHEYKHYDNIFEPKLQQSQIDHKIEGGKISTQTESRTGIFSPNFNCVKITTPLFIPFTHFLGGMSMCRCRLDPLPR